MPLTYLARTAVRSAPLLVCVLPFHSLLAQAIPSQSQTPPGEEVERRTNDAKIDLTIGGALTPPPSAETVRITIRSVTLDGGFDPVAADSLALLPKPGSEVTLADIYAAAASIQQAYLAAGYPLVRVFVPVQDLDQQNASVSLKVVSGFVGNVETDSLDPRVRKVVSRFLASLIGKENLTAATLERAVLLAGDVSGVELSSALSPGTRTGETILIVTGRYRPFQAVLSFDNRLSPELGREQVTLSTAFNSLLGLGERVGVTVATALDDPSLGKAALRRFGGIYIDLPVGNDGLVIGADAALSTGRPAGAAAFLALSSRYEHFGGRVSYPIIRDRSRRLIATASLDFNKEKQDSLLLGFPVPLFEDRTRVARVGINGSIQTRGGVFAAAEVEYSRGFDILDARRASEASVFEPLSRIDADAVFNKLTASVLAEAGLPGTPVSGRVVIRGQTGFGDPLLRSEQFSIAAPDLISGPPTGSLVGDTAIAGRAQVEAALHTEGARIAPYVFAAGAHSRLERPTFFELERTNTYAAGVGLNLEIPIGPFAANGAVEFSHTGSDDINGQGDWVTFRLGFRF